MNTVDISALTSLHARWTEARQGAIASNIAHVDTVGATSRTIAPFADVLGAVAGKSVALVRTDSAHLGPSETISLMGLSTSDTAPVLQDEMVELARNKGAHSLNVAISGAFHRMHLMTVRS